MDSLVDALNYVLSWLGVIGLFLLFLLMAIVVPRQLITAWRDRRRAGQPTSEDIDTPPIEAPH